MRSGSERLEPVAAPFADAPYEGEDEAAEDTGIPEVPEDVPGLAAVGRWASKAPPPPGPRPPSRSLSGVLEVRIVAACLAVLVGLARDYSGAKSARAAGALQAQAEVAHA